MTKPNITNENYSAFINDSINDSAFPNFNYGEKMYMIYNNALTACIPLFSVMLRKLGDSHSFIGYIYTAFKIAGVESERMFRNAESLNMYLSVEDYYASKPYRPTLAHSAEYYLYNKGYDTEHFCGTFKTYGYKGNKGVNTTKEHFAFDCIWFDEDGFHCIESKKNAENGIYKTKEQALQATKINKVVDFDCEITENKSFDIDVLGVVMKVTAKSENDAEKQIREFLRNFIS